MNYITDLIEEDMKYICSVIPYKETIDYFKQYPKEFSKLKPGFRAKSLNEKEVTRILFDFRNRNFVSSFIVKHIDRWLQEIKDALNEAKNIGLNYEERYINVLSHSVFSHNIKLYYKLKEDEKTEEHLCLMSAAVKQLSEAIDDADYKRDEYEKEKLNSYSVIQNLKNEVDELEKTINKLRIKLSKAKSNEEKIREIALQKDNKIEEQNNIIDELRKKVYYLDKQITKISNDSVRSRDEWEEQNNKLKYQLEELENENSSYKDANMLLQESRLSVSNLKTQMTGMEETIDLLHEINESYNERIEELEKLLESNSQHRIRNLSDSSYSPVVRTSSAMPKRPVDLDDFDEYFKHNLNNIGLDDRQDGYRLFVRFVEKNAFNGVPLLIKRAPGINLANCLANTLYGQKTAPVLPYSGSEELESVREFLELTQDRVVCIDGFVGNCNCIELLTILESYRDKIIVLTYMYDRTLNYLPMEILTYVQYINVDEFKPLLNIKDITEEPYEIIEESYAFGDECYEKNRYQKIFIEISEQCGICKDVVNTISTSIGDNEYLSSMLMFTVLPYIHKVKQNNPYNCSDRLQKYAGESGKCEYKSIMLGWFG